ncbi:DUF6286 domain-containing protein [Nocardioides sp. CER19]|uniref:DUF6286 domain-containing protein n=1 Tax=Nocardioides sp. CER19 TaxID=3038538 RepID=UPI00244816E3|nr:DUF6286 domain-containing protein [Nocardioides sp. CER19]MDH2413790.1 DUF6286 domain-containing protein [Nocardioides sp. CER19]
MTATGWVTRLLSALLALALLLGSLLAVAVIAAAALGREQALVPYPEWARWLRTHDWNDRIVMVVLGALVVVGLLLLLLAFRRGKPASFALNSRTDGVTITASRRSLEKYLAAAAARTNGVSNASVSLSRRSARVDARTVGLSESGTRDEVETAVTGRLDALDLERRMRTQVALKTKDKR